MNKRILFNLSACQPIGNSKYHGGGKYGYIVFKKLIEIAPEKVAAYYNDGSFIDDGVLSLIKEKNIKLYRKSEINLYDAARQESSIVYSPLYNYNVSGIPPEDIILIKTQHGIRQLEMPSDSMEWRYVSSFKGLMKFLKYRLRNSKKKQVSRLKKILNRSNIHYVTVSEHSKYAMMAFLPDLNCEDLNVFYSPSTISDDMDTSDYKNPYGKYYFLIGANRWIKNNIRAMIALDQLFSERPNLEGRVVVTGIKSWKDLNVSIKNKNRFVLVGYVDEYTLKALYRHAYLMVYPSLNEGFGYPPLEAMHEGCPVIASSIASIPEICGDGVVYFNPYLVDEIKMRILQMEDVAFRSHLIEMGKQRESLIHQKQEEDLEKMCNYILSYL